jgi:hypothetical protein
MDRVFGARRTVIYLTKRKAYRLFVVKEVLKIDPCHTVNAAYP